MRVGPGVDHERRLRQPAALHLPRLLPAGLQGEREGEPADHAPAGRDRARRGGAGRLDGRRGSRSTSERPLHRRHLRPRRRASTSSGPTPSRSAATRSRRRGCCSTRRAALPERARQRRGPGRAVRDGAGRDAGRGALPGAAADVQGAAARGLVGAVLRDRRVARLRARVLDPDDLAAADRLGRARARRGPLGAVAARVHARLQPLDGARRAVRAAAAAREPRDARADESDQLRPAGRRTSATRSATTTARTSPTRRT